MKQNEFFNAFIKLSEIIHKRGEEVAKIKHERRKAKARARYAIKKRCGTLPSRKKKVLEPEREYEMPTSCYCSACNMPPCSWCEGGGQGEEES